MCAGWHAMVAADAISAVALHVGRQIVCVSSREELKELSGVWLEDLHREQYETGRPPRRLLM